MTDLPTRRRLLWPIVAAAVTVPTAGAGVYYAIVKPGSTPTAEAAQPQESSSLDAAVQALAGPQTPPPAAEPVVDPLAAAAGLPADATPAAPITSSRYGTIMPVEIPVDSSAAETPDFTAQLPSAPAESPAEADIARGQSPSEEPEATQPPVNSLRGDSRYDAVPPLPDVPPAMASKTVNPLRATADSPSPTVEPLESSTPTTEAAASSPPNPFASANPTGNGAEPTDQAALEQGFQAAEAPPVEPESPIPGTRSVLVNNRGSASPPPSSDTMVPVEPLPPRAFAPQERSAPLGSEAASTMSGGGVGKPGERTLEGPQRAGLVVQKFAPAEIQVGKPCKFVVKVRNESDQPATEIAVRDEVPEGTRLINTTPTAESRGSEVIWQIGTLSPGEERAVEMQLEPIAEGQIGSVATVTCAAHASARTVCTRPQLALRLSAPPQVLVGRQQRVQIEIQNSGTGDATGVMLLANIPENLRHPAGPSLEFAVGTLRAGETRQLELMLTAEKPGEVVHQLVARGDGNLQAEEATQFEVIAPALEVAVEGPRKRFLERPATFLVNVHNPGTAAAKDVELITKLPRGMRFVKANNLGEYDPTTHSVHWSLAELPEGKDGSVELVTMPVESGQHTLQVEGRASEGLEARHTQDIQIEGLAAIDFEVLDQEDPIEVGGETTYEIRVTNQGTKAATNVRVAATLPPGMNLISATGETNNSIQAGNVAFEPIASLAPKADTVYRLQVQVAQPGDLRLAVEIQTDDLAQPIRKEESTRVFGDE